jgi:hypothetical protein
MAFELLRPLIVPSEYFDLDFPAPHVPLVAPDLALTWVELEDGQTMTYVTKSRAAAWDQAGQDWRTSALRALREADAGQLWTYEKRNEDGSLQWVGMMHADGLGSSRLLLSEELHEAFPEGYWVAIPDRSCGIAASKALSGGELEQVRALVESCFAKAAIPMCRGLREAEHLACDPLRSPQ